MVPAELYNAYSTALSENDRQARAALAAIMSQLDQDDVDGIRNALLQSYPALVRLYGTRAAQVALEFYMGVREAQKVASPFYAYLPTDEFEEVDEAAVADVRREVGGLYAGQSTLDSFTSTMQGLVTKRTMGMADSTLYALAQADPAHPKAAFVAHLGACGWCILMSSRGFTNTEEAANNMRHENCKCTVVVDFDRNNPALRGYDPGEHYAEYSRYANDPEFQKKVYDEWNAMSDEQRAKYVRRVRDRTGAVKEHPGDWSTYVRNRTVQEMNVNLGHTQKTWVDRYGSPRGASQQVTAGSAHAGTDPEMSKRADDILKALGIR